MSENTEEDFFSQCHQLYEEYFGPKQSTSMSRIKLAAEEEEDESLYRKKLRYSCTSSEESITERSDSNDHQDHTTRIIKLHVYAGGESGNMIGPFMTALALTGLLHTGMVAVEYKFKKDFNLLEPKDLIDWLVEADVHFLLTHPLQAMTFWHCSDLFKELHRLKDHTGWPCKEEVDCPIFTQDKYKYLDALPQITNPTLKVNLPFDSNDNAATSLINAFVENGDEGQGFVVKPPFETNCGPRLLKFCRVESGINGIYSALNQLNVNCYPRLPYVMIQPTMQNRKEYKVILD
jgi:hypothetical protein